MHVGTLAWLLCILHRCHPHHLACHSCCRHFDEGGRGPKPLLWAKWKAANKLAFAGVKQLLGGRLHYALTGGAALSPTVQEWFDDIGIPIIEVIATVPLPMLVGLTPFPPSPLMSRCLPRATASPKPHHAWHRSALGQQKQPRCRCAMVAPMQRTSQAPLMRASRVWRATCDRVA